MFFIIQITSSVKEHESKMIKSSHKSEIFIYKIKETKLTNQIKCKCNDKSIRARKTTNRQFDQDKCGIKRHYKLKRISYFLTHHS